MLLNQIMLYFMTGGTEEEVKEEIKRKIKCGVEIEDVDKEEPQALVIESASSAVNALEVEVLANKCGALKQPDEETPELESISVDQNIETGSRKENNSKDKNNEEEGEMVERITLGKTSIEKKRFLSGIARM